MHAPRGKNRGVTTTAIWHFKRLESHRLQSLTGGLSLKKWSELVPLYNRLTERDLLARCSRMKMQNANESFNALFRKRCPKTEFVSLQKVETSVALAALEFNLGPKGMERALLEMKIEDGSRYESQTRKATQHRLSRSRTSALDSSKAAQKRRRLEAVASEQKRLQEENPTYAAGLF